MREWRRVAVDVAVAVAAFAVSAAVMAAWAPSAGSVADREVRDPGVAAYAVALAYCATVAVRSWWPLGAAVASLVLGLVYAAGSWPVALLPVELATMYTAASRSPWPVSRVLLALGVVASYLTTTSAPGPTDLGLPALVAGAWLLGHYVRSQRAFASERARQAVVDERVRIARELHDVVAHTMSVVAVHAGTGRLVVRTDPAAGERALATIETATRAALAEMRRLLGVLRAGDDADDGAPAPGAALAPSPGLADLDALVGDVRASGVVVSVTSTGAPPADLPAGVDLSAYRIVQEALTNVLRHAGAGARAVVSVSWSPSAVTVSVVDDGPGRAASHPPAAGGSGHGLVGMRERVAMHGGALVAGPRRAGGGFSVEATLPFAPEGER